MIGWLRLCRTAGSCLAFGAGLAGGSAALQRFAPPMWVSPVSEKLERLAAIRTEVDTLFLGSSRIYHSIAPAVFDEVTRERGAPTRSFNLGVEGMNFPETGYVLEQALKLRLPRLRRVFLETSVLQTIIPAYQKGTSRIEYWHDWRRTRLVCGRLLRSGDRAGALDHARLLLSRSAGTGRGAKLLSTRLQSAAAPARLPSITDGFAAAERKMSAAELAQFAAQISGISGAPREPRWDPEIQAALDSATALVRHVGAEPVFLIMPAARRWPHVYERPANGPEVLAFDDPVRYPDLYEPGDRFDAAHLNGRGAVKFTRILAEACSPGAGH